MHQNTFTFVAYALVFVLCVNPLKEVVDVFTVRAITLSYLGGGAKFTPLLFFLHHPKTAQGMKLKLSDFKDTLFASKTSSLHFELLPWQQNYKRYLAEFGSKEK